MGDCKRLIKYTDSLTGEKKVIYRLNFESRKDLQAFKENLNKADNIEKINVIYN